MSDTVNVIFLGAGPTALAGIREVGEYDRFNIFAIGLNRFEAGLFSKYTYPLGHVSQTDFTEGTIHLLETFASKHKGINILIPTGDEFVELLTKNKAQLNNNFEFHILEQDVSDIFLNKEKFYRLCLESNTPAPKTWTSSMGIALNTWGAKADFPCFIKPIYYHKWAKIYGLKKGFLVHNKEELLAVHYDVSKHVKDLIVQEVIEGDDDQIVVFTADFDWDSNPRQIFTARKKRQYPNGFGTTSCAISEDIVEIKTYAINIMQYVKYKGVCDIEFKYDKRDKSYKIIEINPRIGRWYRLATKSSKRPLLSSILNLTATNAVLPEKEQKSGIVWLFPIRDFLAIFKMGNLAGLIDYSNKYKVWCVFDPIDIKPFFFYFMEMISKVYSFMVRR